MNGQINTFNVAAFAIVDEMTSQSPLRIFSHADFSYRMAKQIRTLSSQHRLHSLLSFSFLGTPSAAILQLQLMLMLTQNRTSAAHNLNLHNRTNQFRNAQFCVELSFWSASKTCQNTLARRSLPQLAGGQSGQSADSARAVHNLQLQRGRPGTGTCRVVNGNRRRIGDSHGLTLPKPLRAADDCFDLRTRIMKFMSFFTLLLRKFVMPYWRNKQVLSECFVQILRNCY